MTQSIVMLPSKIIEGSCPCQFSRFVVTSTVKGYDILPFLYKEGRGAERPNWKSINKFMAVSVSEEGLQSLIQEVPERFRREEKLKGL